MTVKSAFCRWIAGCAVVVFLAVLEWLLLPSSHNSITPQATPPGQAPQPVGPRSSLDYFPTPSPEEKVWLADVHELDGVIAERPTPTYSFHGDFPTVEPSKMRVMRLFVTDPTTGKELRLGDDSGQAEAGAMTDEFVVWRFLCDPNCKDFKQGLHIYRFAAHQDTWITDQARSPWGSINIGGQWVLYRAPPPTQSEVAYATCSLHAYNVASGQDVVVAENAFCQTNSVHWYATVKEDMVAWIGAEPIPGSKTRGMYTKTLNVYDLVERTNRVIPTDIKAPIPHLLVSREAMLIRDPYWRGYDLKHDALFTAKLVPPGWEWLAVNLVGDAALRDNHLFWTLEVQGQYYQFTGSIIPKSTGQTPELVPTPWGATTAVPPIYVTGDP